MEEGNKVISRRGFFGLLGGALAAEAARKIYVLPPLGGWKCAGGLITQGETLFYLPSSHWRYRYAYWNTITGHISDATPEISRMVHTFSFPESDVVDIYYVSGLGELTYFHTATGVKG